MPIRQQKGQFMKYIEECRDLFSVPDDVYFAQCISADFAMGKGIAVQFNQRFDTKNKIKTRYGAYSGLHTWDNGAEGFCLLADNVLNLVTKRKYYEKPTYDTLKNALEDMKQMCRQHNIKKIAMPQIACGLDKLQWDKVSAMIQEVFSDTEIEILVCRADNMLIVKPNEKSLTEWKDILEENGYKVKLFPSNNEEYEDPFR